MALFGWSRSASSARRTLIDRLDARKQRHELESLLLIEGGAFGTARLARQWLSLGQVELARPLIDDLATRFAEDDCIEGQTGRELAAKWRTEFAAALDSTWPNPPLKSEVVSHSEPLSQWFPLDWSAPRDRFHENDQLWLLRDAGGRVVVARDRLGREQWRSKLSFDDYSTQHVLGMSAAWHARWLALNVGDQFLVFDTLSAAVANDETPDVGVASKVVEPRLMWQSSLVDRRHDQQVSPSPIRQSVPVAGMPDQFRIKDSTGRPFGRVAFIGHDVVCHQTGNRMMASQLATGDILWIHDGLPVGCELSGDERVVVAVSPDEQELLVLNTLDGRWVGRHDLGSAKVLGMLGRNLLTWTDSELRLLDAATNAVLLREKFPLGTLPCVSLEDAVAMLEPTGRFTIWSLRDGSKLLDQSLPPMEGLTHFVVLRDRERWLLLTHLEEAADPKTQPSRVGLLHFGHWRVRGPAFAFDRATGQQKWSTTLDGNGLLSSQSSDSPVLLFASRVPPKDPWDIDRAVLRVVALDKREGRQLPLVTDVRINRAVPKSSVNSSSLSIFVEQRPNLDVKAIDVQVERDLYRLTFEK